MQILPPSLSTLRIVDLNQRYPAILRKGALISLLITIFLVILSSALCVYAFSIGLYITSAICLAAFAFSLGIVCLFIKENILHSKSLVQLKKLAIDLTDEGKKRSFSLINKLESLSLQTEQAYSVVQKKQHLLSKLFENISSNSTSAAITEIPLSTETLPTVLSLLRINKLCKECRPIGIREFVAQLNTMLFPTMPHSHSTPPKESSKNLNLISPEIKEIRELSIDLSVQVSGCLESANDLQKKLSSALAYQQRLLSIPNSSSLPLEQINLCLTELNSALNSYISLLQQIEESTNQLKSPLNQFIEDIFS